MSGDPGVIGDVGEPGPSRFHNGERVVRKSQYLVIAATGVMLPAFFHADHLAEPVKSHAAGFST